MSNSSAKGSSPETATWLIDAVSWIEDHVKEGENFSMTVNALDCSSTDRINGRIIIAYYIIANMPPCRPAPLFAKAGLIVAGVFHNSEKTENGALESNEGWKGLCRKGVSNSKFSSERILISIHFFSPTFFFNTSIPSIIAEGNA